MLAAVGVLVGCESDRERPSATLPPLASTTPAPTEDGLPGPEGYPIPVEAQAYTPEGATAFLNYFLATLNSALVVTQDAEAVRYLSQASCDVCQDIANGIDEDREAGNRREGGEATPSALSAPSLFVENGLELASFGLDIAQSATRTVDPNGQVVTSDVALLLTGSMDFVWLGNDREWQVSSVFLEVR